MSQPEVVTEEQLAILQTKSDIFWSHVDKTGGLYACWPWQLATQHGYGVWTTQVSGKRHFKAHRVAYLLAYGHPPQGKPHILHFPVACHNRACCNPLHLYAGDASDNTRDKYLDGTIAYGERNGQAKHPENTVRGDRHWARTTPEKLRRGENHGVHLHPETSQGQRNGRAKLTDADVIEARRLFDSGRATAQELAERYGVSLPQMRKIVHRYVGAWQHLPQSGATYG